MMKKTTITYITLLCVFTFSAKAQQEPLFTQYAFNPISINPAIAGTHSGMSMTAMSRVQWAGLEGAPQTHIFSAHAPLVNNSVGLGVTFMHDQIGVSREDELGLQYAYNIDFENSTLSFGLRSNFNFFNIDHGSVDLGGIEDPSFGSSYSDFKMNFGTGIYWYASRFYLGLSMPYINASSFEGNNSDINYTKERIYYLIGGYVFDLGEYFKIKPYANLKYPAISPFQMDLNLSLIYDDKVFLGGGYRPGDSFSAMFEWQIQENFRLGYASDFYTNNANNLGGAVHEFMVNYILPLKKQEVVNPRYF